MVFQSKPTSHHLPVPVPNKGVIMKILQVYRSEPNSDVKTLVAILNRDREADEFYLNVESPDYDLLVAKVIAADKTVSWW
ncbi:MAG: hypothetical protein ACD_32C00115G0002 [uncultured bacterium]|nr:MAG: hypothetical protein ACD_32C00115G0002 [uncultured bacterium]